MKRAREEPDLGYIVGIDPQPTLFGVQCRNLKTGERIAWFNVYLKKKQRFENSQQWEEYVYEETKKLISVTIPKICKVQPNFEETLPRFVTVEQQKGRVCSIMECTVLCVCKELQIDLWVANPMCWKRKTGVQCTKSHHKNKKVVEEMVTPELEKFVAEKYTKEEKDSFKKEKRKHDLCDADKITEAGIMYFNDNFKNEPAQKKQKTVSCDEKHLTLYYEVQQKQCPNS
jgi:hypothetical protein